MGCVALDYACKATRLLGGQGAVPFGRVAIGTSVGGADPVWTVRIGADKQTGMTQGGTEDGKAGGRRAKASVPAAARPSREDRRKAALKANMARRKDQARLRAAQRQDGDTPDENDERGE